MLGKLRSHVEKMEHMQELRDKLMRDAHRRGHTHRDIAEAVDMSHTKVAQIVNG